MCIICLYTVFVSCLKCQKEKGKKDWYYSKSYYLEIPAHILLNILQITSL